MKKTSVYLIGMISSTLGLGLFSPTWAQARGHGPIAMSGTAGSSMMSMGAGNKCKTMDIFWAASKGDTSLDGGGEAPLSLAPVNVPNSMDTTMIDSVGGRLEIGIAPAPVPSRASTSSAERVRRALAALATRDVRVASIHFSGSGPQ